MLDQNVRTIVDLCRYHMPAEDLPGALPVVLATGVIGLALCLGGARSIKTLVTAFFAVMGAVGGDWISTRSPFPPWVTIVLGVILLTYAGSTLYRVWVGVASAVMLTTVVMMIYGGHTVLPSFHEFNRSVHNTPFGKVDFSVEAFRQAELKRKPFRKYFEEFWEEFKKDESKWKMHMSLMVGSAALAGLVFGSLAPMFSSALWTSTVGTVLLAFSVIAATITWDPAAEMNYIAHADWVGWTLLSGIALTTWLQWQTIKKPKKKPVTGVSSGDGAK